MCEIKKPQFVQVHCHSSFSNLDGAGLTENIVKKAKEFGHPALATTEHGSPSALFEHYKTCKKHGIKPILGLEFYICNDLQARVANKSRELEDKDYHQSIYIKDKDGYQNFNYMTYVSFTDGYYYKPRIDFDLLFSRKKGLMATSSCIASKIHNYLTQGMTKEADELFYRYSQEFGDDFYAEIQFNELNDKNTFGIDQRSNNQFILDMAQKYDVKTLIGGDVHYVEKIDNVLQDALINSKVKAKEGEAGFQIHARHLYYHDVSDYYDFNKKFGYNYDTKLLEECFENSISFADKVTFEFETGKYHLPKINMNGMTSEEYIEKATWDGLSKNIETERKYFPKKYTNEEITAIEEQTEYELKVFKEMGLVDYMLMVHDIIKWEKENDIFVGPGRGSAAGSLVAWALGITGLNPLEHNLLFERFVNPNRKTMADIDWDSEQGGRDKVLEYLVKTYGQDRVCNVATFGKYSPKSALQDMSRGLRKETGLDSILMRKICKLPEIAKEGVDKWKPKKGELIKYFKDIQRNVMDSDIQNWIVNNQDTIDLADRLQGQMKNLGTHAGGIVVTPEPIYNFLPVTRGSGNLITAFSEADGSSKDLSELGILKLDVLGLVELLQLKECCNQIKKAKGEDIREEIFHLPLDDKKMLDYFATGNNFGIFQMDRSKMFTNRFKEDGAPVDSFEDIVAINAMNRPGPLEKYLPKYGLWKAIDQGKTKVTKEELEAIDKERYPFEFMRKILSPTHGCLLYQEQLMQLVCELTGMNFGESDSFRRAIAWRPDNPKFHTVAKYFEAVEKSMLDKGYTKDQADFFLNYLRDFAGYSFNRCFSGDEKIYRFGQRKSTFHPTIREMYNIKNNIDYAKSTGHYDLRKKYNKYGYGNSFSLNEDNVLVKNHIVDIRYEGIKPIYRVTLESGKTIDVTMNHKFPTSNGEKALSDIVIGEDKIYVNTGYVHIDRSHRFNTGLSNLPIKGQRGFQKLKTNFTELQDKTVLLLKNNKTCQQCPSSKRLEIHHIDGDHGNQDDNNLIVLCSSCHKKEHYRIGRVKVGEKGLSTRLENIVSIEFLKNDEVYDVEMEAPYHNLTVLNGIVASNSHSVTYSYITWQTLYFKVYYPAYFYAALLNCEDKVDGIQAIIEDAKKNGIEILSLNIAKSEFKCMAEGDKGLRLGYKLIKGLGSAVEEELELLQLHKCKTIDEILQKPFKKINATALQNLITLGCFDDFGVDRELIIKLKDLYKEPKIEKWFTKKRGPKELKHMPEILKETFGEEQVMKFVEEAADYNEPAKKLVEMLTPFLSESKEDPEKKKKRMQKEMIQAELELLGFSISVDDEFNSFARSMKSGGFYPLSEYEDGRPFYFKVVAVNEAKTKTGKTYWIVTANDGRKDFKMKLWRPGAMLLTGNFCVCAASLDEKWGWTLEQYEVVK